MSNTYLAALDNLVLALRGRDLPALELRPLPLGQPAFGIGGWQAAVGQLGVVALGEARLALALLLLLQGAGEGDRMWASVRASGVWGGEGRGREGEKCERRQANKA